MYLIVPSSNNDIFLRENMILLRKKRKQYRVTCLISLSFLQYSVFGIDNGSFLLATPYTKVSLPWPFAVVVAYSFLSLSRPLFVACEQAPKWVIGRKEK